MTTTPRKPIPIYTTKGEVNAFMVYPVVYNLLGDWIGFITPQREVYSVHGEYVGWLSDDPRILRKRTYDFNKPKLTPPPPPRKFLAPPTTPLAPLMPELTYDTIDVLMEDPDLLPTADLGELRADLD